MITSFMGIQNLMMYRQAAISQMMHSSDIMLSAMQRNNSQPLKPSFSGTDTFELQTKSNDTKVTVTNKLIEAMEKAQAEKIKQATPKYGGLNQKA